MVKPYVLTSAAEMDWQGIIRYTLKTHGKAQVRKYTTDLIKCLDE